MSKTFYKMEGDVVQKIEERVIKEVTTEDFIYQCQMLSKVDTGILPRNCIAVRYSGKVKLTVLEMTPRQVAVKYRTNGTTHELSLSVPFVQFYQVTYANDSSMGNVYISCTKKRVAKMDDPIFIFPVLNQYDAGNSYVCTGNIALPVDMPQTEKIERFIGAFFDANFNDDLGMRYPAAFKCKDGSRNVDGMIGWSKQTEKNKMFGLSKEVTYAPHKLKSVDGLMDFIITQMTRSD